MKSRFVRDDLPTRLGNLASNLTRIGGITPCPKNWPVILRNIREGKYFIEWTASELPPRFWDLMVHMQVQLAHMEQAGRQAWSSRASDAWRTQVQAWSNKLVEAFLTMKSDPPP